MSAEFNLVSRRLRYPLFVGLSAVALFAGCTQNLKDKDWATLLKKAQESSDSKTGKPKGQPKFEVGGQTLGEGHEVSLTSDQLKGRLQELLTAERTGWAAHWVERNSEAALEALRTGVGAEPDSAIQFIAAAHDRQCTLRESPNSWSKLFVGGKQVPPALAKYGDARRRFKEILAVGHVDKAIGLNLPKLATDTGSPLVAIDAFQLTGTAQMLADRPAQAVESFGRAVELAEHVSPYQAAYILLLVSDAQRRSGDAPRAAETWRQSVTLASRMLTSQRPVFDPVLWERLSYLRPVELQWPAELLQTLLQLFPLPRLEDEANNAAGRAALAEAVIWNAIGHWYLDRNHAQAALVAFKRAESAVNDPMTREWLRICEARSLVFLDQIGPATAILIPLVTDTDSTMARPAMGLLGSLRLKSGQVPQGLTLLKRSIEEDEAAVWPDHTQSLADLGLAYLMVGEEQLGLKRLRDAEHRFEIAGENDSLAMALENEAAFLENTKRKKEAAELHRRVREMQQADHL